MPRTTTLQRLRPSLLATMTFLVALAIAIGVALKLEQLRLQSERSRVGGIAGEYAVVLQGEIERSLSVAHSLGALVRQGRGEIRDFDATANDLLANFPGASALGLDRLVERGMNYRLSRTHPDSGREHVIAASTSSALVDPVEHSVQVPDGRWKLAIAPVEGWADTWGIAGRIALGTLVAMLLGWLVMLIERLRAHRGRLELAVARRTAEVAAREADLNRAQSLARIGSWAIEYPAKTLHWSEETYRILGITVGTVVDQTIFRECIHPEDRAAVKRDWTAALAGKPYLSEFRVLVAGDVRWVRSEAEISFAPDGRALRGVGTLHDITGRRKAEEALQQSEMRFRGLFFQAPIGMAMLGTDGRYLMVNDALCRITGYGADELVRTTFADITHPDDVDSNLVQSRSLEAGEIDHYDIDKRYLKPDRSVVWVHLHARMVRDAAGSALFLLSIVEDITGKKAAEAELRIAATAFEAAEGMFVTNAQGVIQRVNHTFTKTTGYAAEEAVGQTPRLLRSGRHDADFYAEIWNGVAQTGVWCGEIWNRRKSGEVFPEWVTITAVKGPDDAITNYVCTLTDITLRKATEDEIRHLAFYDPLTALPNRRLLRDRLQHAIETGRRSKCHGALLFMDLDKFKSLNDTRGHDMGDQLLEQVARRLEASVRKSDTIARIGGDEFVVLLENLSANPEAARQQATVVAKKILACLGQPYLLACGEHCSTPSIGITTFCDSERTDDELLKQADLAMYEAKSAGRNTLRVFEPPLPDLRHAGTDSSPAPCEAAAPPGIP